MTANQAEELTYRIQTLCDDIPDNGINFAESISNKTDKILSTILKYNICTDQQARALTNMYNGLLKWFSGTDPYADSNDDFGIEEE